MTARAAGLRPLGRTGLRVSPVCLGTSPLASMPGLYGYEVAAGRAEATILAALRGMRVLRCAAGRPVRVLAQLTWPA